MGLIYDSADSSGMMTALSANLSAARSMVEDTENACHRLVGALGTGELSGKGYAAVGSLFSQAIVPTLTTTQGQLTSLQKDLETYRWEDSKVSRFGVLKEDELTAQLTATKAQRDATESLIELNSEAATALAAVPALGEALGVANRRLELVLGQLENDIRDLEDRLLALQTFDAATKGLFQNELVDTESRRRSPRGARVGSPQNGSVQPASLVAPAPGASAQQIAQWLITGAYSIGALTTACGGAAVMAAITLITMTGSTSGSRFYTPAERLRRSALRWYYYTHSLDGTLKQRIGPPSTTLGKFLNEQAGFENVESTLKEKTRPGKTEPHREVDTPEDLDELAEEISRGGKAVEGPGTYDGTWVELPDGTMIGRRSKSGSGGPTLDIKPPQGDIIKVHLPKGWGK